MHRCTLLPGALSVVPTKAATTIEHSSMGRPDRRPARTPKKLQKSALKPLKRLSRVTLCAGAGDTLKNVWAPARFGGTGPCFAVGETSASLQMVNRRGSAFARP